MNSKKNIFQKKLPAVEDIKQCINFLKKYNYSKLQFAPYKEYNYLYKKYTLPALLELETQTLNLFENNEPILYEESFSPCFYEQSLNIDDHTKVLAEIFLYNSAHKLETIDKHCKEVHDVIMKYAIIDGTSLIFPYRIVPIHNLYLLADPLAANDYETVFFYRDSIFLSSYILKNILFSNLSVLDIGTGSGILAFVAGLNQANKVYGIDINKRALHFASVNKEINEIDADISWVNCSLDDFDEPFDVCISNPPYMYLPGCDCESEDGGGDYGLDLAFAWLDKIKEVKKRALLIVGSPIIDHFNYFERQLKKIKYKKVFSEIQTLVDELRDDLPYTYSGISKIELAIYDIDPS
jgi:SAM-dependent methyltransferase